MTLQFNRFCDVTVHDRKLHGLDVDFTITRSLDPTANTAELVIYNLSTESRKYLSQQADVICKIEAGYKQDPFEEAIAGAIAGITEPESPQIFLGELREISSTRDGADWTTRLSAGDGDALKNKRVSFSVGPGTTFQGVVDKMTDKFKDGLKNSAKALLTGKFAEVGKSITEGFTADGFLGDELPRVLKSGGLEMSVQNRELQILPIGKALGDVAIKITPHSGLVGSPEVAPKNEIKFRTLLNPKLSPGRAVVLESENIKGRYRCHTVTYTGQISGNDWYCDVLGQAIK